MTAVYCSDKCQERHWPRHELTCLQTSCVDSRIGTEMRNFIITVPHAACMDVSNVQHTCDAASSAAARMLREEAERFRNVYFFENTDVYRLDHDMNRVESRKTKFRVDLTSKIQALSHSSKTYNTVLIDVHSFPPGYGFGTEDDAMIVFMEPRPTPWYSVGPISALESEGILTKFVEGHHTVNDIELEARNAGLKAVLMEVRENTFSEEALRRAMRLVATAVY
jgi:hypothetical protein